MLDDQHYTARRQQLRLFAEHKGIHCMENEWYCWFCIHVLTYVLDLPNVLLRQKTYHGDICKIFLGRAMTTKRYEIVDWIQSKYTLWHWSILVYHVVIEDGPRWLDQQYPPFPPTDCAVIDENTSERKLCPKQYHTSARVAPPGQVTQEGMQKARIRQGGFIKPSSTFEQLLLMDP